MNHSRAASEPSLGLDEVEDFPYDDSDGVVGMDEELLQSLANEVKNEYQKRMDILNDEIDDLSRELDEYKKNELLMQQEEDDQKQRIEVLENELYSKSNKVTQLTEKLESQKNIINKLQNEISKTDEEVKLQIIKHEKEIAELKRSQRNQHRTLSVQIDTKQDKLNMATLDHRNIKLQLQRSIDENNKIKRQLQTFTKKQRIFEGKEQNMKDKISQLLKDNAMKDFEMDMLEQIQLNYDEGIHSLTHDENNNSETADIIFLGDEMANANDDLNQALEQNYSLADEFQSRMRSHSNFSAVSQDSLFSAAGEEEIKEEQIKEENNRPQKRVLDDVASAEVTAELVFVRLSVMAVAIKFSHLGVYNAELLKLATVCVKNNSWQWFEVYDKLIQYMNQIEECVMVEPEIVPDKKDSFVSKLAFWKA